MGRSAKILLPLLLFVVGCGKQPEKTQPVVQLPIKNVLLITIDTLRADALSIYGNKTRSPFFERMAADSTLFDQAITVAPLTLPAHTSILTGLYPPSHGVRNNGTFRAPHSLTLLSEIAQHHNLTTAAVIGGFPLAARFGLNQGFGMYDDSFSSVPAGGTFTYAEKTAESVRLSAESWLQQNGSQPFFLWMHFFDPHHPYLKHDNSDLDPYLQEVLYVDQQLEKFFDFLRTKDLYYQTLVVIVGDHGEAFGEHGEISHSIFVYNTTLRVPLLIHAPGYVKQRSKQVVRVIDIFPTILEMMKWQYSKRVDGVSLVAILKGKTIPELEAYSETLAPSLDFGWSPLFSMQTATKKFIEAPREEFYDLKSDPKESKNLAPASEIAALKEKMHAIESRKAPQSTVTSLSAEEREKLSSLGYASSGVSNAKKSLIDPKDKIELAHQIAELTSANLEPAEKAKRYQDLIQQDPENPLLLLRYGEVLASLKQPKEASDIFQKVIALDYRSAAAYNGLAAIYFQQNKLRLAEKTLMAAVHESLADGETYYNLAEICLNRDQFDQALIDYKQSMTYQFPPVFHRVYEVALGYRQQGDIEKSRQAARLFLEDAPPDMKEQRAAMQKLL